MKTYLRILGVVVAAGLMAFPVFAAMEASSSSGGQELTLADFQRTADKPVVAWERYREYKYRLAHPAPQPTLEASQMRTEPTELTLADFQRSAQKPSIAMEQYRQYKNRLDHPVTHDNYLGTGFVSSGKPSVDWRKTRLANA